MHVVKTSKCGPIFLYMRTACGLQPAPTSGPPSIQNPFCIKPYEKLVGAQKIHLVCTMHYPLNSRPGRIGTSGSGPYLGTDHNLEQHWLVVSAYQADLNDAQGTLYTISPTFLIPQPEERRRSYSADSVRIKSFVALLDHNFHTIAISYLLLHNSVYYWLYLFVSSKGSTFSRHKKPCLFVCTWYFLLNLGNAEFLTPLARATRSLPSEHVS